jgi:hypothetical protein
VNSIKTICLSLLLCCLTTKLFAAAQTSEDLSKSQNIFISGRQDMIAPIQKPCNLEISDLKQKMFSMEFPEKFFVPQNLMEKIALTDFVKSIFRQNYVQLTSFKRGLVEIFSDYLLAAAQNKILLESIQSFDSTDIDPITKTAPQTNNPAFGLLQKITLPPGSIVTIIGDIHGSWHSLIRHISTIRHFPDYTLAPNHYLICLGDYSDRGWYGLETLATLAKLKTKNPNNVFLLRGNHEQSNTNMSGDCCLYRELNVKCSLVEFCVLSGKIRAFYKTLPSALIIESGTADNSYRLLFCHGGLPVSISGEDFKQAITKAKPQFCPILHHIDTIREDGFHRYDVNAAEKGFRCGDFCSNEYQEQFYGQQYTINGFAPSTRVQKINSDFVPLIANESACCDWMAKSDIRMIFRGHQHHGSLRLLAKDLQPTIDAGLLSWRETDIDVTPIVSQTEKSTEIRINSLKDIVPVFTLSTAVATQEIKIESESCIRMQLADAFEQIKPIYIEREIPHTRSSNCICPKLSKESTYDSTIAKRLQETYEKN